MSRGPKTFQTNEVVWGSEMIAMKPDNIFGTAEIELCRWVMSNGPFGQKMQRKSI